MLVHVDLLHHSKSGAESFVIHNEMFVDLTAFSSSVFLAAIRNWLSPGRVKGEACRDGNFRHSPPAKRARKSRRRQPSKDAH